MQSHRVWLWELCCGWSPFCCAAFHGIDDIRLVVLTGQENGYGSVLKDKGSCVLLSPGTILWKDAGGLHLEPLVTDLGWVP